MCNLNAFQRLEKDATELVAKKITEQTKSLMSVSKKYTNELKNENDLAELNSELNSQVTLSRKLCEVNYYNKEITGSGIALDVTSTNSFITFVFYINFKNGNGNYTYSEVKFLDTKDYNDDYLKETLDKVVDDWVSMKTIQQNKEIEKAKKKLAEQQSETKAA